jgi:hypothetical protein
VKRLFGQIERGLVIQFRVKDDENAVPDDAVQLKAIQDAGRVIKFPEPARYPVLLSNGDVIDGDDLTGTVTRTTKKVTKTTTTSSKNN